LKDPVKKYEEYIKSIGIISEEGVQQIKNEFKEKIEDELAIGFNTNVIVPDTEEELEDVFQSTDHRPQTTVKVIDNSTTTHYSSLITHDLRLIDAISEGLKQSMQHHPNLILMGQDIAEYGGAFKITEGL
jgi:Pyruvate/2-oxoglutarate dehydrogenase complex, dehydrogenase (E1) component, eukaryotic type, beta subunit